MNIVQLKSIRNLYVFRQDIKDFFISQLDKKKLYFVTLTFPLTWREKALKLHLLKIRYYLKLSNRRKKKAQDSFDYFWIKEESSHRNIHFHMIINGNYENYSEIQKDWNRIISQDIKAPSTHVDPITSHESINKCVNYMFKDILKLEDQMSIQPYGMSKNLSDFLIKKLGEKRLTLSEN